jgi:hypothetical protein
VVLEAAIQYVGLKDSRPEGSRVLGVTNFKAVRESLLSGLASGEPKRVHGLYVGYRLKRSLFEVRSMNMVTG